MEMEYTKEMIVENTNVEEVENDMIKLSIAIDETVLSAINLIGIDEFNNWLHEERLDSYIEDTEIVDYFLDKEHEFNGDLQEDTKYILMKDTIDAMNKTLSKTILGDVDFIERKDDYEVKLYFNYYDEEGNANIDLLNKISEYASLFILSSEHVAFDIEVQLNEKWFVLTIDTESFEESLQNI